MRSLILAYLAVLFIACGASDAPDKRPVKPATAGETIFNAQCALCHGRGGNLGLSGAKDLTKTMLTREEMIAIVSHGKGGMMAYSKVLSAPEIEQVVDYARSLKTAE